MLWLAVTQHLRGALWLLRFSPRAFSFFDVSVAGARFSFVAAIVAAPLYVLLVLGDNVPDGISVARFWLVQLLSYVAQWALMPLVLYYMCQALGQRHLWLRLLVPYNWLNVWQLLLYLVLLQLVPEENASGLVAAVAMPLLLAVGLYMMGVQGWIYNYVLKRGPLVALLLVALNVLVDWQLGLARFTLLTPSGLAGPVQ